MKSKVFISSVQSEFAQERKALSVYIREDAISGTGVIVDKCAEQGLSLPDFDPTVGFFKMVIWREGTQLGLSRGTQSAHSQGTKSKGLVMVASYEGSSRRGRVKLLQSF